VNLNADLTRFRRRGGAALLAVVALLGWFAYLNPVGVSASAESRDTISRGTDAVQPAAHTSDSRVAERTGELIVDHSPGTGVADPDGTPSVVGTFDRRAGDSTGSTTPARGPPASPTA
jgi:hypothetical protein